MKRRRGDGDRFEESGGRRRAERLGASLNPGFGFPLFPLTKQLHSLPLFFFSAANPLPHGFLFFLPPRLAQLYSLLIFVGSQGPTDGKPGTSNRVTQVASLTQNVSLFFLAVTALSGRWFSDFNRSCAC